MPNQTAQARKQTLIRKKKVIYWDSRTLPTAVALDQFYWVAAGQELMLCCRVRIPELQGCRAWTAAARGQAALGCFRGFSSTGPPLKHPQNVASEPISRARRGVPSRSQRSLGAHLPLLHGKLQCDARHFGPFRLVTRIEKSRDWHPCAHRLFSPLQPQPPESPLSSHNRLRQIRVIHPPNGRRQLLPLIISSPLLAFFSYRQFAIPRIRSLIIKKRGDLLALTFDHVPTYLLRNRYPKTDFRTVFLQSPRFNVAHQATTNLRYLVPSHSYPRPICARPTAINESGNRRDFFPPSCGLRNNSSSRLLPSIFLPFFGGAGYL